MRLRLKWCFWFMVVNIILSWIFGIKYLTFMFPLDIPPATTAGYVITSIFIFVTYFSYLSFLTTLFFLIVLFPLAAIIPHRRLLIFISSLLTSFYILLLLTDSIVFRLFRLHLNGTYLSMIFSREVFEVFNFSHLELAVITAIGLIIFTVEFLMARININWVSFQHERSRRSKIIASIIGASLISFSMYYIAVAYHIFSLTQQVKVMPYYTQLLATVTGDPNSLSRIERYREDKFLQLKQVNDTLHYPLQPLHCKPLEKPLNVVFIVIDTWRFDALTKKVTPQIFNYVKQGINFTHHYSGGNSTQPGIFTLFYGIPNSYWTATLAQGVSPVLIDEFQRQHYALGIFASARLTLPAFNQNVFVKVPHLKLEAEGDIPANKDRDVTASFQTFLKNRPRHKPFFAFLFYDAAHAYCTQQNYPKPYQPATKECLRIAERVADDKVKFLNRYLNALHFVDTQVGKALASLRDEGLLKNTVVILTGDHGQEFDDNNLGYWEHASNYTPYQIQTPMLVLWPKKQAETIQRLTTHYDISPTIMTSVLQCQNPTSDYSIGNNLFSDAHTTFTIAGSYINFGIVDDKRITIIYPSGTIEIQDLTARPVDEAPNQNLIISALQLTRKFFQPSSEVIKKDVKPAAKTSPP